MRRKMKLAFKNRFFVKMLLSYCLVIFCGLGLTSYLVTSSIARILTEKESMIEREVIQKVKAYSDDKHDVINGIFAGLYMKQYFNGNISIVDFINPDKESRTNDSAKMAAIVGYLHDICSANAFISDFFIIDYHKREVFFASNIASRDVSLNYDFYGTGFLKTKRISNSVEMVPNHIPDYINSASVNNFPVIAFRIYLFDSNSVKFDKPIGMAVINVKADFFKAAYKDSEGVKGNIYVLDQNHFTLFDSSGAHSGRPFPFASYTAEHLEDFTSNEHYIVNMLYSKKKDLVFVGIVDREVVEEEANGIRASIYNITGACVAGTLLISLVSASVFTKRIRSLVKNMQDVEIGKLNTRIAVGANDEVGYLEQSFNTMCERLEEYIKSVYIFEIKTKTAELRALQAQINPHFLFNTLESIRLTAQLDGAVQAAKMIHILGNMLRWNIQTKGMFVELKEEIDYVCSYIDLERMRHDNAFDISIDFERDTLRMGVPKLVLQPLVENAIQHGLSKITRGGHIAIRGRLSQGDLKLEVSDNGKGMDECTVANVMDRLNLDKNENIALSNIHQRISILFGEGYGLGIHSEPDKGTKMTVSLPARRKEEMGQYVQSVNR